MPKRGCSRAKSSWSAEISMTRVRLLKESLCFTMIRPSPLAHWIKLRWHIGKQAKPTKPIGCHASCASDIQITPPAGSRRRCQRSGCCVRLFRSADDRDAPWAVAHFDATQFLARFEIDDRDVVRGAVRGVQLRSAGVERYSPCTLSH